MGLLYKAFSFNIGSLEKCVLCLQNLKISKNKPIAYIYTQQFPAETLEQVSTQIKNKIID